MGQKDYIIAFAMVFIFSFALINFAIGFATDNDSALSVADDDTLSTYKTDSDANMVAYRISTNGTLTAFDKQGAEVSEDNPEITQTAAQAAKEVNKGAFTITKDMIQLGYAKIFGSDSGFEIVFGTILTTLGILVLLYTIKTIRGGNPD